MRVRTARHRLRLSGPRMELAHEVKRLVVCSRVHATAGVPHFWQNFHPGFSAVPHAHVLDAAPDSRVPQAVQTAHDGSTG